MLVPAKQFEKRTHPEASAPFDRSHEPQGWLEVVTHRRASGEAWPPPDEEVEAYAAAVDHDRQDNLPWGRGVIWAVICEAGLIIAFLLWRRLHLFHG